MKQEIIIGKVKFTNETIYSQSDKIRDKGYYKAEIKGLSIIVGNCDRYKEGVYFSCKGIGIDNTFFTNKNITFGVACLNAFRYVRIKLLIIINLIP